jgi:hypothetical protein
MFKEGYRFVCDGCGAEERVADKGDTTFVRAYRYRQTGPGRSVAEGRGWQCRACHEAITRYFPEQPDPPRTRKPRNGNGGVQVNVHNGDNH